MYLDGSRDRISMYTYIQGRAEKGWIFVLSRGVRRQEGQVPTVLSRSGAEMMGQDRWMNYKTPYLNIYLFTKILGCTLYRPVYLPVVCGRKTISGPQLSCLVR